MIGTSSLEGTPIVENKKDTCCDVRYNHKQGAVTQRVICLVGRNWSLIIISIIDLTIYYIRSLKIPNILHPIPSFLTRKPFFSHMNIWRRIESFISEITFIKSKVQHFVSLEISSTDFNVLWLIRTWPRPSIS